jgi:hypothetical protein
MKEWIPPETNNNDEKIRQINKMSEKNKNTN